MCTLQLVQPQSLILPIRDCAGAHCSLSSAFSIDVTFECVVRMTVLVVAVAAGAGVQHDSQCSLDPMS